MNFESFNFHPKIVAGIKSQNFVTATPIQEQAIPSVLAKKDLLGIAQTGTGKTAAFVLPILQHLMQTPKGNLVGKVRALILAPTRELAIQIDEVLRELGRETNIRSVLIFGGVNIGPQIKALAAGVDVVVACPGRLIDHIERQTINLATIEIVVLDEADQMFDMGFLPAIRQIVKKLPTNRQTLLFSATMPEDIRMLANQVLTKPITVEVGRIAPPQTIEHALYPVAPHQKNDFLKALFNQIEITSMLVFTRTKHRAKQLALHLNNSGYSVTSLQGNLSQNRRMEAMNGFKDGKYKILVATDIAARGIDISSISHVINFDIPGTPETYTHRIGRTGRASRSGEAYTLVGNEDAKMIKAIEKLLGESLERRQLKDFSYETDQSIDGKKPASNQGRPNGRPNGNQSSREGNFRKTNFRDRNSNARNRGPINSRNSGNR